MLEINFRALAQCRQQLAAQRSKLLAQLAQLDEIAAQLKTNSGMEEISGSLRRVREEMETEHRQMLQMERALELTIQRWGQCEQNIAESGENSRRFYSDRQLATNDTGYLQQYLKEIDFV